MKERLGPLIGAQGSDSDLRAVRSASSWDGAAGERRAAISRAASAETKRLLFHLIGHSLRWFIRGSRTTFAQLVSSDVLVTGCDCRIFTLTNFDKDPLDLFGVTSTMAAEDQDLSLDARTLWQRLFWRPPRRVPGFAADFSLQPLNGTACVQLGVRAVRRRGSCRRFAAGGSSRDRCVRRCS